jgi:uncharacterized delta-60 repeat protein
MSWVRATAKARKAVLLLFPLLVLLAGGAPAALGQTVADDFDPKADDVIRVIVVQPDGKVLIGGQFSTLAPNGGASVVRNRIARLNPDGTLDTAFNPNANNDIDCIALQADGKVLVGGKFTTIGGQSRQFIARLDATTGLADSFSANPTNSNVIALAVQPDGMILVGGNFTGIAGQERRNFARLDPTTGQPDSLDVNADDDVNAIALQGDGKILVGGWFNRMGGQTRHHMARLDPVTGLADSFNPDTNGPVLAIAVQGDGKVLAGGGFLTVGGQMRSDIARLDATTGMADSFNPNADDWVYSIALQADGKILAGGRFRSIGGQPHAYIARLNSTTGLADLFVPYPYEAVYSIAVQTDGKVLAGGAFSSIGRELRYFIGRLVYLSGPPPAAQPLNLSTRMKVQTGENVGIGGFIITGNAPKHVVLRVIGPSMGPFPPDPSALRDPVLELHGPGAFVTITNDNWRDDPEQEAAIRAAGLALNSDLESAIDTTLLPGSYTGVVRDRNNGSGIAVIEIYDLSQAVPAKLANISTRAFVGTGNNIVIAGFILGGHNGNDRIIIRGLGTSLIASGVSNALANPKLELRDQNGVPLMFINDWQEDPTQAAEISAAGLEPGSNLEPAIAATLPPGSYTTLLYGVDNGTGLGLIEVYDLGAQ